MLSGDYSSSVDLHKYARVHTHTPTKKRERESILSYNLLREKKKKTKSTQATKETKNLKYKKQKTTQAFTRLSHICLDTTYSSIGRRPGARSVWGRRGTASATPPTRPLDGCARARDLPPPATDHALKTKCIFL
jgi:hypothetical protein